MTTVDNKTPVSPNVQGEHNGNTEVKADWFGRSIGWCMNTVGSLCNKMQGTTEKAQGSLIGSVAKEAETFIRFKKEFEGLKQSYRQLYNQYSKQKPSEASQQEDDAEFGFAIVDKVQGSPIQDTKNSGLLKEAISMFNQIEAIQNNLSAWSKEISDAPLLEKITILKGQIDAELAVYRAFKKTLPAKTVVNEPKVAKELDRTAPTVHLQRTEQPISIIDDYSGDV